MRTTVGAAQLHKCRVMQTAASADFEGRFGGRTSIASAGCTAMRLAPYHAVFAVDINPAQLAYAKQRNVTSGRMRVRMERCFRTHPNRWNPYARALLVGELSPEPPPPEAKRIELVQPDAATFLEQAPPGRFDGFTLSNILDGASQAYRQRLFRAIGNAESPEAMIVLRRFGEPVHEMRSNRAADDSSILWGIVDVRPAAALHA